MQVNYVNVKCKRRIPCQRGKVKMMTDTVANAYKGVYEMFKNRKRWNDKCLKVKKRKNVTRYTFSRLNEVDLWKWEL